MGIELHARTDPVERAEAELRGALLDVSAKHGLTPIEQAGLLVRPAETPLRYALRFERHGAYNKKADEA